MISEHEGISFYLQLYPKICDAAPEEFVDILITVVAKLHPVKGLRVSPIKFSVEDSAH